MHGYNLCLLAEAYQFAGQWNDMVVAAKSAIEEAERTGILFYLPEAYRLLGEGTYFLKGNESAITKMLLKAARIAEQKRSYTLQLKASNSFLKHTKHNLLKKIVIKKAQKTHEKLKQLNPDLKTFSFKMYME